MQIYVFSSQKFASHFIYMEVQYCNSPKRLGLLFGIVTHPLLVILSKFETNGDIVDLHLWYGEYLVTHALIV